MWTVLLLLYRLLSWPVSIASQAAMVVGMGFVMVGALRLLFSPPMAALATAGVGVAIVGVAMALYIAVAMLGQAIEDRRDDAEPGVF